MLTRNTPAAFALLSAILLTVTPHPAASDSPRGVARPVIATLSGDLNGDGVPDRAVLTGLDDEADLAVHLSVDGALPADPTLYRQAIGWKGELAGTLPEMSITPRGSLVVVFQNDAIGRNRWREQLTIAFRNGVLVVAGYTNASRDTLDPKGGGSCDLNLLSGKGVRNGKPIAIPARPVPLADWTQDSVPESCVF
ncbi:hypothetical protein J2847_000662 [Azospirillum agricola]|uniref:hypothetical protein n=1 Tax=Azospirillum agricola TaxID=1720247 RepID=UPI001AE5CF6A|nr:hypothetical protein [Azospirillum agricola]MBP2227382.1 hypothetical protein [Azospirillum agricola]